VIFKYPDAQSMRSWILPALSAQWKVDPRGDVLSMSSSRWRSFAVALTYFSTAVTTPVPARFRVNITGCICTEAI
jgi:hypothetical protein